MIMLRQAKPLKVMQIVLEQNLPIAVSYFSEGRWCVCRAVVCYVDKGVFGIRITPQKKSRPIDIAVGQAVGVSFKAGYGQEYDRFIFDTKVAWVEKLLDTETLGVVKLLIPEQIEVVQRRSYVRVPVPQGMKVDVELWQKESVQKRDGDLTVDVCQGYIGSLVDISAAGLQVAIDYAQGPVLKEGQFVGLKFVPLPDETTLTFNAYIRTVLPEASGKSICIGLEMIGLEASPEGRLILQRLCNVVEQYEKINKAGNNKTQNPESATGGQVQNSE
jgi:c-di-GMP-binding flagellar brake protein YcgR